MIWIVTCSGYPRNVSPRALQMNKSFDRAFKRLFPV